MLWILISVAAPTQILTARNKRETKIPIIYFPLGVFLALMSLYILSHKKANETKKIIQKNVPDTIISIDLTCLAVIQSVARAEGF